MTVYAFVPARGGSERVRHKNLRLVGRQTLLQRALHIGHNVADRTIISTDDDTVKEHAAAYGAAGLYLHERPSHLAGPHSQIEEAIAHWMHRAVPVLDDLDVIVLLQPTSPFRTVDTVRACVALCEQGWDAALTVTMEHRNSGRVRSHLDGPKRVLWNRPASAQRPRSQEARVYALENGVAWAFTARHFRATGNRMGGGKECIVPTSWVEAFEIDTDEDLRAANALRDGLGC